MFGCELFNPSRRKIFIAAMVAALCTAKDSYAQGFDVQTTGVSLEVMASPAGFTTGASLGHAFICVDVILNIGSKEDCYGFYSKNGGKDVIVGGPGQINSEFKRNVARFGNIAASYKHSISIEDRRKIYQEINKFNSAKYKMDENNCIDLVDKIVKAVGWNAPTRSSGQFPVDYVRALATANGG